MKIRHATAGDVRQTADLVVRMKRLNNEFDPLFTVVDDIRERAEEYVAGSLGKTDKLLLVAAEGPKVVGVLRAEIRKRLFYEPGVEGLITDFYILPEFRRKAQGNEVLKAASTELKRMGAEIILAEVPTQNEIAVRFYTKRGFRPLVQHFGSTSQ